MAGFKKILLEDDFKIVSFKFSGEGSTTTSTTYVTIANSDVALNPADFKVGTKLYVKFIFHLKNQTADIVAYIQVYRQNAATAVTGSEKYTDGVGTEWEILDTGWLDWNAESGAESYQIQLKTAAGGTVEFNSALMILCWKNF